MPCICLVFIRKNWVIWIFDDTTPTFIVCYLIYETLVQWQNVLVEIFHETVFKMFIINQANYRKIICRKTLCTRVRGCLSQSPKIEPLITPQRLHLPILCSPRYSVRFSSNRSQSLKLPSIFTDLHYPRREITRGGQPRGLSLPLGSSLPVARETGISRRLSRVLRSVFAYG